MSYYSGTIQKGSYGDDVKKWQEYLKSQGYDIDVDGIFGDTTHLRTMEWQTANGLDSDGIVGQNTWGKAGFSNINTPVNAPTAPTFTYNPYNTTEEGAEQYGNMNSAYDAFTGYGNPNWDKQGQADELLESILTRPKFTYDFNADALYQQYKDKYIQQGKMAMADAMGQASAMTGGYGNSYAASVGNQAYQAHLNNLNDIIPDLYNMAYNRYNQEGQDLYNQYGLLMQDYEKYMNDWKTGYGMVKDAYDAASGAYYDAAELYGTEQNSINTISQQEFENAWKLAEWEESMRRYERENTSNSSSNAQAIKDVVLEDKDDDDLHTYETKSWKDHNKDDLKANQAAKGGSYYSTARNAVDTMIKQGKDYKTLMSYAQEMVGNSYLSQSEYMTLVQYIRNKLYD